MQRHFAAGRLGRSSQEASIVIGMTALKEFLRG